MTLNQPLQVLIADDEIAIRDGLYQTIDWSQLGLAVIGTAKDGEEAWDYIDTYQPAIVITDIRMPRLSGLDLIKRCRQKNLSAEFVILSGYDDFSYAQTAIQYGARAYLLKPLKIEELIAELEELRDSIIAQNKVKNLYDSEKYQSLQISSKKLFLKQLIQNDFYHKSDIYKKLQELQLPLSDSPYRVVVFSLSNPSSEIIAAFIQHTKTIVREFRHVIWENSFDQVVMILHYDQPDQGTFFPDLAHYCIMPFPEIIAGIGSAQTVLSDASHSYNQALTALSYRLYEDAKTVYDQSVICQQPPTMSSSSIDTTELVLAIKKNDESAIKVFCEDYFSALLYVSWPPPGYIRGMLIYLITDIQNALCKIVQTSENLFPEFTYTTIHQLSTLSELKKWTTDLFLGYAKTLTLYLAQNKDGIIVNAKQYILTHMNQKIQAEDVAAHISLSTSYFSSYFKSKTGSNFRDYVLKVKMEHAKQLLASGSENISEISYAVGYDDYRSFYRAFKNYTGMTPSEYQCKR